MKRPLVFAAGGFVLGEVWLLLPVGLKAVIPAIALCGVCCLWKKRRQEGKLSGSSQVIYWVLPFVFMAALGAWRLEADRLAEKKYEETAEAAERLAEGSPARLEGILADISPGNGETYEAVLQLDRVSLHVRDRVADYGSVLVYLDEVPDRSRLRIGMKVSVRGQLERMGRATNPGQFDYGRYYHALGIEGRVFSDDVEAAGGAYSPYLDGILRLKEWAADMLENVCDSHDRGLFQAVVLGDKSALPDDVYELYQKNGIAHLLAVSGLHISLIGLGLYRLFRRVGMGFEVSGALAGAFTVSYGILTGSSASVMRAVLMVCCQLLADKLGRTYDLLSAMAAAAILLLIQSPSILFQAGFQLSFGAVLAVGAVLPVMKQGLGKIQSAAVQSAAAGLAIQVVTFPIIAYHFCEYPVYGFFLNLLVIPLMGYVLLSGIGGILLGAVWLPFGRLAAGSGHWILAFYEWLCRRAERLPGAIQIIGRPWLGQICAYALLWLGILCLAGRNRKTAEKEEPGEAGQEKMQKTDPAVYYAAIMAAAGTLAGFLLLMPIPVSGLRATFLDVGQGDGICLEAKDVVILADGGSTSNKNLGEEILEPFLKYSGISRVDYAVISHGDEDHISGVRYLLESDCGIAIDTLVLPRLGRGDKKYEELVRSAERAGTEIVWMKAGDEIQGNLNLRCLYAGDEDYREDTNDHSLLLEASYGDVRLLLTGDISGEGEGRWLEQVEEGRGNGRREQNSSGALAPSGQIQVLKVAHHGSDYSTTETFLEYIDPDWAVISCGADNTYGHPGKETMERLKERGIRCFLTMEEGAVIITTDGRQIRAGTAGTDE